MTFSGYFSLSMDSILINSEASYGAPIQ